MQNTNTATDERTLLYECSPSTCHGKILVTMMEYPTTWFLNGYWNDLRSGMTDILVNGTPFNMYVGGAIRTRLSDLTKRGFVLSKACPDRKQFKVYALNPKFQVVLKDKKVEVYEKPMTKIEKLSRRFFSNLWK